MTATISQGTATASFAYDTEHDRVQQTLTSGSTTTVTTYLTDPLTGVYSEKAVSGASTVWRDYIMVDGAIVAVKFSGATSAVRYLVNDHLGSTSVAANEAASVVERDSYDAWGKRRVGSSWSDDGACAQTSLASRGYTGHEHIDALCLINMNARIYDPTLGRFLSADSIIPDAYNGQSLNRYTYVNNGPLSATDPSGHECANVGVHTTVCWEAQPSYSKGLDENGVETIVSPGTRSYTVAIPYDGDGGDGASANPQPEIKISFTPSGGGAANNTNQCSVSAASINRYLRSKGSPVSGNGQDFMNDGAQFNEDPRLLVSIMGAETTFGKKITAGKNNLFNNLYNGLNSPFDSYSSSIYSTAHSLSKPKYDLTSTSTMYSTYCTSGCRLNLVDQFMKEQGGNPNSLRYPCKKD